MEKGATVSGAEQDAKRPPRSELWDKSTKLLYSHPADYIFTLLIFVIIFVIISVVFYATLDAVAFRSLYVSTSYFSGSAVFIYNPVVAGIVELVYGALLAIIGACFIASLYETTASIAAGRQVDYAKVVLAGTNRLLAKMNTVIAVAVVGAIGGLISGLLIAIGLLGNFIGGLLVALWVGMALTGLSAKADINFLRAFGEIGAKSSNSSAILYVTLLVAIVPVVGPMLAFLLAPLAVIILVTAFGVVPAPVRAATQKNGQQSIKVE